MTTNSNKKYIVEGGYELNGTIQARGAKNAITKQLVASVLTDEPCTFNQVPRISEIDVVLDMLSDIGPHLDVRSIDSAGGGGYCACIGWLPHWR